MSFSQGRLGLRYGSICAELPPLRKLAHSEDNRANLLHMKKPMPAVSKKVVATKAMPVKKMAKPMKKGKAC